MRADYLLRWLIVCRPPHFPDRPAAGLSGEGIPRRIAAGRSGLRRPRLPSGFLSGSRPSGTCSGAAGPHDVASSMRPARSSVVSRRLPVVAPRSHALRALRCETSAAIQSSTIAPMTAVTRLPSVPAATSPKSESSQPPSTPPMSPTIRLTIRPEPLPLTSRLAIHPAASPISRYYRKYIVFRFL